MDPVWHHLGMAMGLTETPVGHWVRPNREVELGPAWLDPPLAKQGQLGPAPLLPLYLRYESQYFLNSSCSY